MKNGFKLEDLSPKHRAQAEFQLGLTAPRKVSRKATEPECDTHQTLENNPCAKKISTPVYLVVLVYRCQGLTYDLDNQSIKPILDALVQGGLLEDDSIEYIQGEIWLPKKCKTKNEERTELEFWDADYFSEYIEAARRERRLI